MIELRTEMEREGGECCGKCEYVIVPGDDTITCKRCKGRYHFNLECSKVRKTRGKNLQRDAWRCVDCRGRQESPDQDQVQEEDHQEQERAGEEDQPHGEEHHREETATDETTQAQGDEEQHAEITGQETEADQVRHVEQLMESNESSTTHSSAGSGRRKCKFCKGIIRNYKSITGFDFATCSKCRGEFHKKEDCSDIKPGQIKDLDMTQWRCTGWRSKPHPEMIKQQTSNMW